jgi:predicted NAD/FAD-dependent oxidoreductase
MADVARIPFERHKFRQLIIYIAEQTADDPSFGDTHLNKALYWTDFDGYQRLGQPVTGAKYFKQKFGPVAKPLLPVRDELADEGLVEIQEPPSGVKRARKTLPRQPADTRVFSAEELQLVNEVIARLRSRTATRVSDEAHEQSAGWNLVEMYDDIPYHTALISKELPSEATLARGKALAARFGW